MNNRFNDVRTINQDRKNIENTVHNLKIITKYFNDVLWGYKTFEVRKNDRDFKVNDIVILEEYNNGSYTGRRICKRITYVLDDQEYCKDGYVTFGMR